MTLKTLLTDEKEDILFLTVNRPEVLNALNKDVLSDLHEVLTHYHDHASIRGIILTGAGNKAFVAGADIAEITTLTEETALLFASTGQKLFEALENYPKPVVAAVNGFALGGGCELAMACHLRVAAPNASFGQPEINLGIIPGYGGTQRLPRLIGRTRATELLLTGDRITAAQALEWGLVNRISEQPETLLTEAEAFLRKILSKSSYAVRQILDAVNACYDPKRDGYPTEIHNFVQTCISDDGREGTLAFIEKRKPVFTGK